MRRGAVCQYHLTARGDWEAKIGFHGYIRKIAVWVVQAEGTKLVRKT
jgi:hypothetical protein